MSENNDYHKQADCVLCFVCGVSFLIPCSWLQWCNPEASSWDSGFLIPQPPDEASFGVVFLESLLKARPRVIPKPFQKIISTNLSFAKHGAILLSVKEC